MTSRKELAAEKKRGKARNGAIQCKLLKGIGTGKPLRDCPGCVADASEFLEEFIND